jgi:hypothetical protein
MIVSKGGESTNKKDTKKDKKPTAAASPPPPSIAQKIEDKENSTKVVYCLFIRNLFSDHYKCAGVGPDK